MVEPAVGWLTGTLGRGTPPSWGSQCSSLRIPTPSKYIILLNPGTSFVFKPGTSRQAALLVRRLALVAGAGACSEGKNLLKPHHHDNDHHHDHDNEKS